MLKIFLALIIISIPILCALAQDSYSIKISCTIPEIPGVNVPLASEDENSNSSVIFENDKEETRLVKGEAQIVTVKTIYSR